MAVDPATFSQGCEPSGSALRRTRNPWPHFGQTALYRRFDFRHRDDFPMSDGSGSGDAAIRSCLDRTAELTCPTNCMRVNRRSRHSRNMGTRSSGSRRSASRWFDHDTPATRVSRG